MTDVATRDDVARVSALFTRGAMDAPDLRGDSMVTKHLEKLQQEKEKQGFAKMQALHPSIGPTVCAIALEETDWEVEAAHELLNRFEEENKEGIALLLLVSEIPALHSGVSFVGMHMLTWLFSSFCICCYVTSKMQVISCTLHLLRRSSCACQITSQIQPVPPSAHHSYGNWREHIPSLFYRKRMVF